MLDEDTPGNGDRSGGKHHRGLGANEPFDPRRDPCPDEPSPDQPELRPVLALSLGSQPLEFLSCLQPIRDPSLQFLDLFWHPSVLPNSTRRWEDLAQMGMLTI